MQNICGTKNGGALAVFSFFLLVALMALGFLQLRAGGEKSSERAFYFWRTVWNLSEKERRALDDLQIGKIYLRFFDVEWSERSREPRPVAPLEFGSAFPQSAVPVPVVYLQNAVFTHLSYAQSEALADAVWKKVARMAKAGDLRFRELQIDCDWSDHTRSNYFHFLEKLNDRVTRAGVDLSTTIRLHQVKFASLTGVPPVAKGMLMFYNMGKLSVEGAGNSVFNAQDAGKYVGSLKNYPLALDLALPIFSWGIHSREGAIVGLLDKTDRQDLLSSGDFADVGDKTLRANSSFFLHGVYFKTDDRVRLEKLSEPELDEAAHLVVENLAVGQQFKSVALFDLDERNIDAFRPQILAQVFSLFSSRRDPHPPDVAESTGLRGW